MTTSSYWLRQMGVGDLLDETIRLFRDNFRIFVGVAAIVQVPLVILSMIQYTVGGPRDLSAPALYGQSTYWILSTLALGILAVLALILVQAALTQVISDRYLQRVPSVGGAYRAAWHCLGRVIWTAFLMVVFLSLMFIAVGAIGFAISFGMNLPLGSPAGILLIVAFAFAAMPLPIYFGLKWSLNTPAVVLEGIGGRRALSRSYNLLKRCWWHAFAVFFIAGIIQSIVVGLPNVIVSAVLVVFAAQNPLLANLVSTAVSGVFQIIAAPLLPVVITLLYYDMRVRKEGFDLQLLAKSL